MRKTVIVILILIFISLKLYSEDFPIMLSFRTIKLFNSEISDARAEALGNCSILSSRGANYLFNNPAMLSMLSKYDIQLTVRAKFGKDIYKYEDGISEYKHQKFLKVIGISLGLPIQFTYKKKLQFGIGVGYRTYFDLSESSKSKSNNNKYEIETNCQGGFNNIVIGTGICYRNNLLFGLSVSIPFLSNFKKEYINIQYRNTIDHTLKGTFITLSGTYIVTNKMALGLRFIPGFSLKWIDGYDDDEVDIKIPYEFAIALKFKPISNLKLFVEYLSRNFSNYELESNLSKYKPYEDFNDGFSLRFGSEFGMNYLLRIGFFLQSLPIYELVIDNLELIYDKKPKTEIGFTTGLGFNINRNFGIDLFGVYSYLNYDSASYVYQTNEFSFSIFKFGCTLNYEF